MPENNGPYRVIASALLGFGLASVLYPVLSKLFAPERALAPYHLAFLMAGIPLLLAAGAFHWLDKLRKDK